MTKEEYITKVLRKYPYLQYEDIEETYEIAKRELFITLYSHNTSKITKDTEIPFIFEYKVYECMIEIIEMGNMRNFTTYSENGWSWSRDGGRIQTYSNIRSMVGGY